jgi:hypothetical protein
VEHKQLFGMYIKPKFIKIVGILSGHLVQFETCVRLRNTLRVAHARRGREIDMPVWELPHSLQLGPRQVATIAAYRIRNSGPQQLDGASLLYSLGSATMKTNASTTRATMKQSQQYKQAVIGFHRIIAIDSPV